MKTQIGQLVGANLHEGTLEIEVGEDIIAKAGKYAVVPIDDYERLVKFSLADVSKRYTEEDMNKAYGQGFDDGNQRDLDL